MSFETKAATVLETITSIITNHFNFVRRCCSLIWYYQLYIEEGFIMRHVPVISTSFALLIQERSSQKRSAKSSYAYYKRKIEKVEKEQEQDNMSLEDKTKMLNQIYENKAAVDKLIHENNIDDIGLFVPDSIFDLTPRFVCFLVGELAAHGLLAIPTLQILLVIFAPIWFMLAIFIIPPILIAYLILTAVYSIVRIFHAKDISIEFD